eukprot:GFUD01019023.1.p1 GENE.GFUD01019023.1~~GFUD01019023.1.p1  ORF type:complete len:322 (-),score=86.73 GFUD01019023.1:102-1067(-)
MADVDPTTLFGFIPNSLYAKLFVDMYHLTKPSKNETVEAKVDGNLNIMGSLCEKINNDEKEEGEIDDNDNKMDTSDVPVPDQKPNSNLITYHIKSVQPNLHPIHLISEGSAGQLAHRIVSWPGTSKELDLQAQIDLDNNPVRLNWLHHLLDFMAARGTPITCSPTIPTAVSHTPQPPTTKQPLDLYSLYQITRAQAGGLAGCTETKGWKAVAIEMNVPIQKSFVLRQIYQKFLLPFEELENNQERMARLPTPLTAGFQSSSFQSFLPGEGRRFDVGQRGRGGVRRGNLKKKVGFKTNYLMIKRKGGNFKKGSVPRFRGFHG